MPTEQINVSLPPQMARFIRAKVKKGQYSDEGDVVRDAVRHMQEADAAKAELALLTNFEDFLPAPEREAIYRSVQRGIADIEAGRFEDFDDAGLQELAKELIANSKKKLAPRAKAK